MLKLYEISDLYLQAIDDLVTSDTLPPDAIQDTLDGLIGTFEQKALAVAAYIRNLEAEAEAVASVSRRLENRQKGLEQQADRLRAYLKNHMERTALLKCKNAELTLSIQRNPPRVIVDDEQQLPGEFLETVTTVKVLRSALNSALKQGVIPGAHLEQSTRLVIS